MNPAEEENVPGAIRKGKSLLRPRIEPEGVACPLALPFIFEYSIDLLWLSSCDSRNVLFCRRKYKYPLNPRIPKMPPAALPITAVKLILLSFRVFLSWLPSIEFGGIAVLVSELEVTPGPLSQVEISAASTEDTWDDIDKNSVAESVIMVSCDAVG